MLEPSERGTEMHQQIEYFLKGKPHHEDFKEFQMFLKFHEEQILKRGLEFYDAETKRPKSPTRMGGTMVMMTP